MTDLTAVLRAIVARGNGYSRAVASREGPDVRFDAARTEPAPAGGDGVVVSFTYVDPAGGRRALEYRLAAGDSLLRELAAGETDADDVAVVVAVNLWEEVEVTGVDAAVANGTFREASG